VAERNDSALLLSPRDAARLADLRLTAARPIDAPHAGRHRSIRPGHAAEFYDYRPYSPGDEVRRVDWKLFGRTDRLYVRRHQHDAQLPVHVLLDRSASMDFSAIQARDDAVLRGRPWSRDRAVIPTKFHHARRLAAALAYLAVNQSDRISLTFFDAAADPAVPLGGTSTHLRQITTALASAEPAGRTDPAAALPAAHAALARSRRRRGLVIVLSDLLTPPAGWLEGLTPFAHDPFDVRVLQILSPDELHLGRLPAMQLIDSETGRRLRTAGPGVAADLRRAMDRHITTLRRSLAAHGIGHHLLRTDADPIDALRRVCRPPG